MKLVIMTQQAFFVEEDKILSALFDEGMADLHLRKPGAEPMMAERLLSLLPETTYGKITVHDHYYLKNEYRLAGIHIDSADAPPKDYRGKVGRTCSTADALAAAKKTADYVFFCAKPAAAGTDTDELNKAVRRGLIDKHVYAAWGISLEDIREAKELGFGGVVVCEDLWNKFDIHNETDYKDLINHFDKLRKATS